MNQFFIASGGRDRNKTRDFRSQTFFLFSLDIKSICSVYFFHASFESLENWFQSACSNLFDPVRHSIHISKNLPGVHFLDIGLIYKRENVHFSIYKSKIMHFSNEFFE